MTESSWKELSAFAQYLQGDGLASANDCDAWLAECGEDATLESFAQVALNHLAEGRDDSDVQALIARIQQLIDAAVGQAQAQVQPVAQAQAQPQPVGSTTAVYHSLPSFSDIADLSDAELAEKMRVMLSSLRSMGCSDFHLDAGAAPFVRRNLAVERISDYVLTENDAQRLNFSLLTDAQKADFLEHHDFGYALELGGERFRVALMDTKSGVCGSYRLVAREVQPLEALGFLPEDSVAIRRLLDYNNGLILVTGPIGAGKTTTLARLTDLINEKRHDHIISIEDPIEIVHQSKNCQVTQRQIGKHTVSYSRALKAALREDPDVIIIGEMRDLETIENAITASETGHLVIGTLHTSDAGNTMNRILDVFPPNQQPQIRAMTSVSLRGIICQKLIPNGMGGVEMIYEILLNSMAVANLISDGKTFQLQSTMAVSRKQGMCTFDQCILEKFMLGRITRDAALPYMSDPANIEQLNRHWAVAQAQAQEQAKRKH